MDFDDGGKRRNFSDVEWKKEIASNQSNLFFNVRMSFTPKKTIVKKY
jgi:hypothetical protein